MTKILKLTSDVVFKSFMMSERTKNYKAKLISLITKIPEESLKEALYGSVELPITNQKDKVYKTDILIRVKGHIINLEMNQDYYEGLLEKNDTYASKLKSEQYNRGDNYLIGNKIIQINFDNFKKFKGEKLVYEFQMLEKETLEVESEYYTSYHIDLFSLKKKCYNELNELEKLCYLFIGEDIEKEIKGDRIMEEAYEEIRKISKDKDIIGLYDKEEEEKKVMNTRIESAKLEGKTQGIEEGSNQRNIEIAKNMLKKDMNITDIMEITGLSKEEIETLDID